MPNVGKGTEDVANQGWGLYIVSVVMVIISGLFVTSRVVIRHTRGMIGMDDWMSIIVRLPTRVDDRN